jgi:hypothetical protein
MAQKYKAEGNQFFKEGNLQKARSKYARVFAYTKGITGGGGENGDAMVKMAMSVSRLLHQLNNSL